MDRWAGSRRQGVPIPLLILSLFGIEIRSDNNGVKKLFGDVNTGMSHLSPDKAKQGQQNPPDAPQTGKTEICIGC